VAGLSAALNIADAGKKVYLIEKDDHLGGHVADLDLTFPYLYSAGQIIQPKIDKVLKHENIEVFLNTAIDEVFGYIGNFEATIPDGSENGRELKFGNIIVATGLKTYNPSDLENYGFAKLPDVVSSIDFESRLKKGKILTSQGKEPKHIAIIHCVGSRNKNYKEYCSRVCCMTALKYANQVRAALPESSIYEIYADMRAFGKGCEEFYEQTSRKGVMFLMYDQQGDLPVISETTGKEKFQMIINMKEQLSGEEVEVPADLVILMTAMEAREDAKDIAHAVGISMCGNEFYIEKHPKLDPVATTTDGVYIVGSCQGPKDITESISQALAAASRVLATIAVGQVEVEVTTAKVNEELCCGCQTCISVCPYKAISFNEEKKVSVVNEVLCKGCGTCGSTCPTGAIRSRHYTDEQILSQIEGLMLTSIPKREILEEA
jgi:heterodisulfide reductase subunit A